MRVRCQGVFPARVSPPRAYVRLLTTTWHCKYSFGAHCWPPLKDDTSPHYGDREVPLLGRFASYGTIVEWANGFAIATNPCSMPTLSAETLSGTSILCLSYNQLIRRGPGYDGCRRGRRSAHRRRPATRSTRNRLRYGNHALRVDRRGWPFSSHRPAHRALSLENHAAWSSPDVVKRLRDTRRSG